MLRLVTATATGISVEVVTIDRLGSAGPQEAG